MTFREETMTLNYKMIKPTENDCYSPRMTGAGENNLFMVFIDSDGKVLTSSSYSGGNNLGNNPVMIHGIPYGENYYASMDIQREEAVRLAVWQGYDQNSQQAIYCSRSRKNRCLILNRAKPPWDTMAWDYFMLFYELGMPLDLIEVKNVLPEDLTPCKYGFLMVLLGDNDHGVGEGGEDAGTLTLEELDEILDFADSGGRVHIEGARFYQDHKDLPINFAHEFGITNSTFYSYPYELDMLLPRRNEKLKINFAYIQGWAPESYSISKDADVYLWDEHLTPVKYYGVFRNWDGNVSLTSMPIWFINENDTTSKRDVINELFNVNFQSKAWQYGNPPFIEVEFEPGPQQFMNAQTGHESGGQDAYSTIKVDIKINALCAFADTLDLYSLVITDADTIQELIKKEYLDLDPGSSVNYNDLEVPVSQGSDNNPNGSSWIEVLMEQPVYWNPYQGMIPPIHYNMHFYSF
jgi:hypothetical protein